MLIESGSESDTKSKDNDNKMVKDRDGKKVKTVETRTEPVRDSLQTQDDEMDRRALPRVNSEARATFELGGKEFNGSIRNMNTEGVFLECDTLVPPFTILRNLRFNVENEKQLRVLEALVVWNNSDDADKLYPRGLGLFFLVIEPKELDRIRECVQRSSKY